MCDFIREYTECALWSSTHEDKPLDSIDAELAPETLAKFQRDCEKFETESTAILNEYDYCSGDFNVAHDFWLTRNHHGAGFWDGDYPEPIASKLTELAHSYGECDLYVGDDGKIYAA